MSPTATPQFAGRTLNALPMLVQPLPPPEMGMMPVPILLLGKLRQGGVREHHPGNIVNSSQRQDLTPGWLALECWSLTALPCRLLNVLLHVTVVFPGPLGCFEFLLLGMRSPPPATLAHVRGSQRPGFMLGPSAEHAVEQPESPA